MEVIKEEDYSYLETNGEGETLLLLHGLFGATGNFQSIQETFADRYNIVTPILPILTYPVKELSLEALVDYVLRFVDFKGFDKFHIVGNSLGGHIGQLFILEHADRVKSLTLTGSSGLFESAMGSSFPKRGDYDFIKAKAESTFYDPKTCTKEIVDEVYDIVNDRNKGLRIVVTAKSAVRSNLTDRVHLIKAPVLLVWGKQDVITPAWVGEKFHDLLPNSELAILDKCGHAPMMEQPEQFNELLEAFISKHT